MSYSGTSHLCGISFILPPVPAQITQKQPDGKRQVTEPKTYPPSPIPSNLLVTVSLSVMSDSLQPHGLQPNQAPLCMEFSRKERWSGQSFSCPGYLPDPGIEPRSPALQADALQSEPPGKSNDSYSKTQIFDLISAAIHWYLWSKRQACSSSWMVDKNR